MVFPNLFSSLDIGPITLNNRVFLSGHSMRHGDPDGTVGDRQRAYIAARAAGGAGLVSLESVPIHESSQNFARQIRLFSDRCIPGLSELSNQVHEAGSRLSLILWHGGPNVSHFGRGPAWAPSPIVAPGTGEVAKAISLEEIATVVSAYGSAARRCHDAGLDAVEVQLSSNYLLGSFLSPMLNQRDDVYGGSFDNRLRIVLEVLTRVREALQGRLALGVRISMDHGMEGDLNFGRERALQVLARLSAEGLADWVSVLSGSAYARGVSIPTLDQPRCFLQDAAREVRDAVSLPTVLAGRIRTPEEAETLLANGYADIVAMARPLIADPEWVNKAAAGQDSRIRPCVSCNQGCLGFNLRNKPGTCVLNPDAGQEFLLQDNGPAQATKTVAVVGGGPAGLETARVAAERGHRVKLYEATRVLGGDLALAAAGPGRSELGFAIEWWAHELERLGVEIALGTPLDASPEGFDRVVWATGADPSQLHVRRRRPHLFDGIPGTNGLPHGRQLMARNEVPAGHVLVIDEEGGWPSISVAEWLATRPEVTAVEVATPAAEWGAPELHLSAELGSLARRVDDHRIRVHTGTLIDRVEGPRVHAHSGNWLGPFDQIVLATGTSARDVPEGAAAVGDCVAPRGLWAAVNDARGLARAL